MPGIAVVDASVPGKVVLSFRPAFGVLFVGRDSKVQRFQPRLPFLRVIQSLLRLGAGFRGQIDTSNTRIKQRAAAESLRHRLAASSGNVNKHQAAPPRRRAAWVYCVHYDPPFHCSKTAVSLASMQTLRYQ